jgi:hypothetical protein
MIGRAVEGELAEGFWELYGMGVGGVTYYTDLTCGC